MNIIGYLDHIIKNIALEHGNIPENDVFIDFADLEGNFEFISQGEYTKYFHKFDLLYGLPFDKPNSDPPIEL